MGNYNPSAVVDESRLRYLTKVRMRQIERHEKEPRRLIRREEKWQDVVKMTLTENELDTEFDAGFGCSQGVPFTLWTERRVYFPAVYDGLEWVASVARNPCNEVTRHVGGE